MPHTLVRGRAAESRACTVVRLAQGNAEVCAAGAKNMQQVPQGKGCSAVSWARCLPARLHAWPISPAQPPAGTLNHPAEWRWHRNQDDGPESADFVSVVRDPDCKSLRAQRLAAWRANQAAAAGGSVQQVQQQQQQRNPAWLEEQTEEQALILEREAERRAATAAQRQQLSEEAEEQRGLWCALCSWARRVGRLLGWPQ